MQLYPQTRLPAGQGPIVLIAPEDTFTRAVQDLPDAIRAVLADAYDVVLEEPAAMVFEGRWIIFARCEESNLFDLTAKAGAMVIDRKLKSVHLLAHHLTDAQLGKACKAIIGVGTRYHGSKSDCVTGLTDVSIGCAPGQEAIVSRFAAIAAGTATARQLTLAPPNQLTPSIFADRCVEGAQTGVKVTVLDEDAIAQRNMGGIGAIAQGSIEPPRVVTLAYTPRPGAPSLALIGKGVTFDSGGLALKAKAGMEVMKYDMAGAAAVVGAIEAIAMQRLDCNIIGVLGLVENMPGGRAVKPGDVITMMSGTSVEIVNPDAEGRIVLGDLLHLAIDEHEPDAIVDIATLTGAIETALGTDLAGLFSSDDRLAETIAQCAQRTREQVWRMPLPPQYLADIAGSVSDLKNMGRPRVGGAVYAALFLETFVGKTPWAHLDIGNTGWWEHKPVSAPQGATGYGVHLLEELARNYIGQGLTGE